MARPRTDKFALRTTGLTVDQAAQLAYIVSCAAQAIAGEGGSDFACSVPVKDLKRVFPNGQWSAVTAAERRKLVQ